MAWPIQPIVRPIANSVSGEPAGRRSTRARATSAKSRFGSLARQRGRRVREVHDERQFARLRVPLAQHVEQACARGSPSRYSGWPKPSIDSPRRSRAATARRRMARLPHASSIDSTRALTPPCFVPSSAASPAITTAYGCDPADATQRAVNDETFSSWSAHRISALRSRSTPRGRDTPRLRERLIDRRR